MTIFNSHYEDNTEQIRAEIAALAARMIAEDGADYGSAKRRAVKQLLGNQKLNGNILPDNKQIEEQVREYNALFFADTQPERLDHLRHVALDIMQVLEHFNPYLVGAVMNGTAGEQSDIHLHLYTDNGKDVAIFLLNKGWDFDVTEQNSKRHEAIETYSFLYKNEGVHLLIHNADDVRHTEKQERINRSNLIKLIKLTHTTNEDKEESHHE